MQELLADDHMVAERILSLLYVTIPSRIFTMEAREG